jgi:hypothetical protein
MASTLTKHNHETLEMLFRHPVAHNLEWNSLITLFGELGDLEEEPNGKYRFDRNAQTLIFEVRGKDVGIEEIMRIRRFMDDSAHAPLTVAPSNDIIVVIDSSEARLFRSDADVQEPIHVEPIDPHGHDRQVHNPTGDSGGQQDSHRKQFYENLAKKLMSADRIVVVGDGHGASCEADAFMSELESLHHDLAERVVAQVRMDVSHVTDPELLAKARESLE